MLIISRHNEIRLIKSNAPYEFKICLIKTIRYYKFSGKVKQSEYRDWGFFKQKAFALRLEADRGYEETSNND